MRHMGLMAGHVRFTSLDIAEFGFWVIHGSINLHPYIYFPRLYETEPVIHGVHCCPRGEVLWSCHG